MRKSSLVVKSALVGILGLGVAGVATASQPAQSKPAPQAQKMVECYGINAAYKNDCKTVGHACAGQDTKPRDPNAFVAVPAGLCQKVAGGSLQPAIKS
ncbi:MAG: DUF2282 domain-containing protein [Rhodanobacteraceae bacterium]|nr:MAG: DUF2282 domain-containing protein [Rhodanobacteraceae bacterium]